MNRLSAAVSLLIASFALGIASPAYAQNTWPERPIRMIVGFTPGGPTDVIARIMAEDMRSILGQSVIVENRAGANSLIATEAVARSAPDGYTLLVFTLAYNVNAILMPDRVKYHPIGDFVPISLAAVLPMIVVTAHGSPIQSLQDLVAMAKASPGAITFGSAGHGGSAHLAAALRASLKKPETRERLRGLGANSLGSTPAEFAGWLQQDFDRWAKLIKVAGVKGE